MLRCVQQMTVDGRWHDSESREFEEAAPPSATRMLRHSVAKISDSSTSPHACYTEVEFRFCFMLVGDVISGSRLRNPGFSTYI